MRLFKILLLGCLLAQTTYAAESETSYRCYMYQLDGVLTDGYYGFTVIGNVCKNPHAFFGKYTNNQVIQFLSCIVEMSTGGELAIRFHDVRDDDSGFSSISLAMSKQMLVARLPDLRGWAKCEELH